MPESEKGRPGVLTGSKAQAPRYWSARCALQNISFSQLDLFCLRMSTLKCHDTVSLEVQSLIILAHRFLRGGPWKVSLMDRRAGYELWLVHPGGCIEHRTATNGRAQGRKDRQNCRGITYPNGETAPSVGHKLREHGDRSWICRYEQPV